ncbi:MAG: ABC transporter substrate-binding protein [Egibacteraceae bacterium]
MRLDTDLAPQPWLAEAVERRSDTAWAISLREGVTFHDSSVVDAEAVKASLERAITESEAAAALLDVAEIAVEDPRTLLVTTATPSPNFPGLLTDPTTAIVSAAAAEAQGEAFANQPVATGMFAVEEFQLDSRLIAVRYDGYWGDPPATQRLEVNVQPDASARFLALQSGQIDIAFDIQPESVTQIDGSADLKAVAAAPVATMFVYLNQAHPPWDDVRVRQALAHAVPPGDVFVGSVFRGQAEAAIGNLPPAVLDCPNIAKPYAPDPEAARALLAEAGYADGDGDGVVEKAGTPLTLLMLSYPQRPALTPMAEIIQASLQPLGIKVEIQSVEDINGALETEPWDGAMYFNNMAATGDPFGALSQFFATGGDANRGQYTNPRVDARLEELRGLTERTERRALACEIDEDLLQDVAIIPLVYPTYVYGVSTSVEGFDRPHPYFLYFMASEIARR